jgi:hypothetical protein
MIAIFGVVPAGEMRQEGLNGQEDAGHVDGEGIGPCLGVEAVARLMPLSR